MKRLGSICISTLGLVAAVGCELRRDNRPSILIVAVENLSFDSVSCDSDEANGGFDEFCEEGIRFTHAFTPSTMSQAALSSVLTGMYPIRHGVHDNGADHLPARFRTIAKAASEKGYRTALISGGPPIFRKSGLSQGFELFDDNVDLTVGHYYRPASDVFSLFNDWLGKEVVSQPFFGTLFLADLEFPEVPTFSETGDLREKTVESQLQEVGESLQGLINQLKARRRWDSTYVILMGLSGGLQPANLKSENTQVTLFIKPARTPRDSGSHWTIDRNVSLVDAGATLFAILGEPLDLLDNGTLEKTSLLSSLAAPEPDWRDDRVIYSESGWTRWRLGTGTRVALRQKQFLYINDTRPLIFNSLTDHLENTSIGERDALWASVNQDIVSAVKKLDLAKTANPLQSPGFDLGSVIWAHRELSENMEWRLNEVINGHEKNPMIAGWWARWALERSDWTTLAKLGVAARQPLWTFTGQSRSQGALPLPESMECIALFRGSASTTACDDETLIAVSRWTQEKNDEERSLKRERAVRLYALDRIRHRLGQLNYLNFAKWDVRLDEPQPPSLTELFLALPRNHVIAGQIENSLAPE